MADIYKIYISSTYHDLIEHRKAAAEAVRALGHQAICMEDYVAANAGTAEKCCQDVRECQVYVGIFAWRYGEIPEGFEKSITNLEYDEAQKSRIPRLLFLVDEKHPWVQSNVDDDKTRIRNLKKILKKDRLLAHFTTPADLKARISAALSIEINNLKANGKGKADRPKQKIPLILPYLSNRSVQKAELKRVLSTENQKLLHKKPLVCISHGDENECHDKFVEIIQQYWLPELLDDTRVNASIISKRVGWPNPQLGKNRFQEFISNLSKKITGKFDQTPAEITKGLNDGLAPWMIYSTLQTEGWQKGESEIIKNWLDYWNEFPDLAYGRQLFIFLCIKYENTEGMSYWQKRKYRALNEKVRKFLDNFQLEAYKNIQGLIFTELGAVRSYQLADWIAEYASNYCRDEDLRYKIDHYYKEFYQKSKKEAIPMYTLATKLKELCKETQKPPGATL